MPAFARTLLAALPLATLAASALAEQSYDLPSFTAADIATGIREATEQTIAATGASIKAS